MTSHRSNPDLTAGFLVVGHGTADARGRVEFLLAAARIAARLEPRPVEAGFLELAEPTTLEAGRRLAERGARHATILPLLLFAAGHARRDLPELAAQLAELHPSMQFGVAPVLRFQPDLAALSQLRCDEALAGRGTLPIEQTHLVLIGRGSSDAGATADMHEFARLRRSSSSVAEVTVGFLAIARPTLDEALEQAAGSPWPRVVVQPHLLFPGQLSTSIEAAVERIRTVRPDKEWILAEPLGDHALLAAAALDAGGLSAGARQPPVNLLARQVVGTDGMGVGKL